MKTTKSKEESIYLLPSSSYRYIQVSKYLADANQPALEIRSEIVTQVVIGYTYIVANGSSCCFFLIRIQGWICRNMEGFKR